MDISGLSSITIGGAAVGLITGAGILLRRFSRDKLEVAKDRAEEDLLTHLGTQRDSAIAEKEKAQKDLAVAISELDIIGKKLREISSENSRMNIQIGMLTNLIGKLNKTLEESKAQIKAVAAEVRNSKDTDLKLP